MQWRLWRLQLNAVAEVPGERLRHLDVVRGVAALSVMLFHLSSLERVNEMPGFAEARAFGWAGVEAFFSWCRALLCR